MAPAETVRVVLVDAETAGEVGRAELPAGQLPATFAERETTLDLAGVPWTVERAEPPTAAEYLESGSLVLTVRRRPVEGPQNVTAPQGWNYTLPTFFDPLPPTEPVTGPGELFEIHEDDWRRTEFVSRGLSEQVEAELRPIREIYERHSRMSGEGAPVARLFSKLYIRKAPIVPLFPAVPRQRLFELLEAGATSPYAGVRYRDTDGRAADSFAIPAGPATLYGRSLDGRVTVLCLAPSPAPTAGPDLAAVLPRVMREFDLLLVDWCACRVVDASGVAGYLGD